ncbi:MAG: hypothetical protein JF615_09065, partial [Asticcacaulis sp.]|nr:hypothetical protein [Asticcacaulis sp.]
MGQALQVNVVRVPLAVGGAWAVGAEIANSGQPALNGYAAVSGRFHRTDYSFGASTYGLRRDLPGRRTISDSAGHVTGHIDDLSPRTYAQYAANGELAHDAWGGRLRGHLALSHSLYADRTADNVRDFASSVTERDANPYSEGKDGVEAGVNFDHGAWGGDLKLAALSSRKTFDSTIVSTASAPDGALWARYAQSVHYDAGEDIVRASYGRTFGRHRVEAGSETAVNRLDAQADVSLDLGAGPVPLHIPNANIRIVEFRAEAYVGDVWTPRPGWSVETRVADETSRLEFSGDTVSTVRLDYLKPSFQVSRDIGRHQLRLRVARDVGQLDFTDFTSAAAFADGRIDGGNPDLKPPATWRTELAFDGRFGRETTASVRLFHDRIDDANDLVPITRDGVAYDAPGNVGRATVDGAQLTAHLPLAPLIPGGRFDFDGTWRASQVTDPLTGQDRPLSNLAATTITAGFRQDVPHSRYAWGVSYTGTSAK